MPEFLNSKFKTSSEMCDDILKKTGVALLPDLILVLEPKNAYKIKFY